MHNKIKYLKEIKEEKILQFFKYISDKQTYAEHTLWSAKAARLYIHPKIVILKVLV